MAWLLRDSVIDALELDDDLVAFAIDMAGERAVQLTTDRENILLAAAVEMEGYLDKMYFRGPGGSARIATSVIEVTGPCDVPAIAARPRSHPVNLTQFSLWDDATSAFQPVPSQARPLGRLRVDVGGTYRIEAACTPSLNYPVEIAEAVARLFSFRQAFRSRRDTSELADGTTPTVAGGVLKSGAAEVVRHLRRGGG